MQVVTPQLFLGVKILYSAEEDPPDWIQILLTFIMAVFNHCVWLSWRDSDLKPSLLLLFTLKLCHVKWRSVEKAYVWVLFSNCNSYFLTLDVWCNIYNRHSIKGVPVSLNLQLKLLPPPVLFSSGVIVTSPNLRLLQSCVGVFCPSRFSLACLWLDSCKWKLPRWW